MVNADQLSGIYVEGQTGGEETHTLTVSEMPAHTHGVTASSQLGNATSPAGAVWAKSNSGKNFGSSDTGAMAQQALGSAGGGQPHNNMMPYTTLYCIISLQGVFPARP